VFPQASDDAKKLVNQEKSFACAEIESARALVMKLGGAFEEQELCSKASRDQGPVCIILSSVFLFICYALTYDIGVGF
jgi:hypothetical protein